MTLPLPPPNEPLVYSRVDDVIAVLGSVGCERVIRLIVTVLGLVGERGITCYGCLVSYRPLALFSFCVRFGQCSANQG